jgi:hypothetical protein
MDGLLPAALIFANDVTSTAGGAAGTASVWNHVFGSFALPAKYPWWSGGFSGTLPTASSTSSCVVAVAHPL